MEEKEDRGIGYTMHYNLAILEERQSRFRVECVIYFMKVEGRIWGERTVEKKEE